MTVFEEVILNVKFPELEENVLKFWEKEKVFERVQDLRKNSVHNFVFLEGPPTANGLPHPGHILTRVTKDLVLRFKTMQGYYVPRKGGWDCHGLPVELEVEKELNLKTKKDIEAYGIEKFNEKCRESVLRYESEWKKTTERVGFWLDMERDGSGYHGGPYITMDDDYIESVWWSLKQSWNKGLLVKSHYVVPWCTRCGTSLSSHEVALGSAETEDPSIFIKFKVEGEENTYFLAWTTTPWTLISNVALAVHPDFLYAVVETNGERYILAGALVDRVIEGEHKVVQRLYGADLEGKSYEPLFTFKKLEKRAHYVCLADFVDLEEGTGIVHTAPAFGPEDYELAQEYDLPLLQLVDEKGNFVGEVEPFADMYVKDADKKIIEMLEERNLLYKSGTYKHDYPFCWRCDTPLLYIARETWFLKMSKIKEELTDNNGQVEWFPEYYKHGRFGNFLENLRDWALSRERYWGTPLPIWTCEKCGERTCLGSVSELKSLAKKRPDYLELHKPWIDEVILDCKKCGGDMIRENYLVDCWYDSGSAPFAQHHYPFENKELFESQFPASFITEAVDQTRGWFYTLLAIGTLVFNKPAYTSVLTLGLVTDEKGVKMSKSKGNIVDPWIILNNTGADAMRWYLFASNAPWLDKRFYLKASEDALKRFLLTLWNVYHFFVLNANVDNFNPVKARENQYLPVEKRDVLDRWIISSANTLIKDVTSGLNAYDVHKAARYLDEFVVDELSNWYVRRSRRRFWKSEVTEDKLSAFWTLYEVLVTLIKLLAPFASFITEDMYQNLVRHIEETAPLSVHMTDYPTSVEEYIDKDLEESMKLVIGVNSSGRSLRASKKIKTRQPLKELIIGCTEKQASRIKPFELLLLEEINVKKVKYIDPKEHKNYCQIILKPNYERLGPKYKEKIPKISKTLQQQDSLELLRRIEEKGSAKLKIDEEEIELTRGDLNTEKKEKPPYVASLIGSLLMILNTEMTPELREEGLMLEFIRRVQVMRKELDLEYTQTISLFYETEDQELLNSMKKHEKYVANETLSTRIQVGIPAETTYTKNWKIEDKTIKIAIKT